MPSITLMATNPDAGITVHCERPKWDSQYTIVLDRRGGEYGFSRTPSQREAFDYYDKLCKRFHAVEMEMCPRCKGIGYRQHEETYGLSAAERYGLTETVTEDCWECDGTGWVEER